MMLIAFLLACGSDPAPPPPAPIMADEVSAAVARMLCSALDQVGRTCVAEGPVATVGEHRLEVRASVGSFVTLPPSSFGRGQDAQQFPGEVQLGVELSVVVDDVPLLSVEQTHAASDLDLEAARAKVLDELVQRWVVTHGSAVLDALLGDPTAPVLASLGMKTTPGAPGDLYAFAGYPVLRGRGFDPKTASKLGPGVQTMLDALGPFTAGLSPDSLHTVQVLAKLGGGGAPGACGILPPVSINPDVTTTIVPLAGQVLVDGQPHGDICALSEPVAWALPPADALLEWDQLFVLARVVPGEPGQASAD